MYRTILSLSFITLAFMSCQTGKELSADNKFVEAVGSLYDDALKPFYHGVASGDPMTDRVIIWTRVTPDDSVQKISVQWQISDNESFNPILKADTISTSPARDYTVKVDVTGLSPGKFYFYRFNALDKTSPVGRTKTISEGNIDSLKFAVVSCSNWE